MVERPCRLGFSLTIVLDPRDAPTKLGARRLNYLPAKELIYRTKVRLKPNLRPFHLAETPHLRYRQRRAKGAGMAFEITPKTVGREC